MQPIREILSCEEKMLLERTNCGIEELNHDLEKINSNRMYVKLTTDADEIAICTESVVDESRYVQVVYNRNTKRFFARNAEGKEISRFRDSCDLVEVEGEITIEYFLDHSMLEVYLNQRKAMTLRNYVSGGERKISVSSNSSKARINSIQIWNMKSAYD